MSTPTLTKRDRCDHGECGSAAYVLVTIPVQARAEDLTLMFCGHHFAKHEQALADSWADVTVDNRAELLVHV